MKELERVSQGDNSLYLYRTTGIKLNQTQQYICLKIRDNSTALRKNKMITYTKKLGISKQEKYERWKFANDERELAEQTKEQHKRNISVLSSWVIQNMGWKTLKKML